MWFPIALSISVEVTQECSSLQPLLLFSSPRYFNFLKKSSTMQVLLLFLTFLVTSCADAKSLRGFSIDLIHRDSPLSPFYNSSMTSSELLQNAALRSISRINRFGFKNEAAETTLVPNRGDYLMKIFIGTPSAEFMAVADTGSDLIWVPCLPCGQCNPQSAFDPKKSSTFTALPCSSQQCSSLPAYRCGTSSQCRYRYSYGDRTFTIGDLATESINFGSNGGQDGSFPKAVFGCGHDNEFKAIQTTNTGIVGLGGGPLSLVSQLGDQLGRKFSYCLLPSSSTSTSKLKFGDQAVISGNGVVSTPLISKSSLPTFYFLNLDGITVGQKTVLTGQSGGNIIIDSGTTLTFLKPNFYESLAAGVKEAIRAEPVQNPPNPFKLCFQYKSGMQIPRLVFHFTGADVALPPRNMFRAVGENLFCFLAVPSESDSIFGNIAQNNFLVGYDLEGKMVSFAPADCTKQ